MPEDWNLSNSAVRTSDIESSNVIYASSLMLSHEYREFLLLLHQAQQPYYTDKPVCARTSGDSCSAEDSDKRNTQCIQV
jgi:hypothetical protein